MQNGSVKIMNVYETQAYISGCTVKQISFWQAVLFQIEKKMWFCLFWNTDYTGPNCTYEVLVLSANS